MQMWEGRFSKKIDKRTNDFNSSIRFDYKMYKQDIKGSIAHCKMLSKQEIIGKDDETKIIEGLNQILEELETGKLKIDLNAEDIHMFVEEELTKKIGDVGKKLHTARSRNDQVALDIRMYVKEEIIAIEENTKKINKNSNKKSRRKFKHNYAKGTTNYICTSFNGICRNVYA